MKRQIITLRSLGSPKELAHRNWLYPTGPARWRNSRSSYWRWVWEFARWQFLGDPPL